MTFSFHWLLSGQMPAQRTKGKTSSFSFTPARNLVSRKISALPFIKLNVGPVDVLGLGDIPRSVQTTGTHLTAVQPSVLCVASWDGQLSGGLCRRQCFP